MFTRTLALELDARQQQAQRGQGPASTFSSTAPLVGAGGLLPPPPPEGGPAEVAAEAAAAPPEAGPTQRALWSVLQLVKVPAGDAAAAGGGLFPRRGAPHGVLVFLGQFFLF